MESPYYCTGHTINGSNCSVFLATVIDASVYICYSDAACGVCYVGNMVLHPSLTALTCPRKFI